MKLPELRKLLQEAKEKKVLSLSKLDSALEEERFFDRNAKFLIDELGHIPVVPDEKTFCADAGQGGLPKLYARSSVRRGDSLDEYLRDIAGKHRMNREEEVRYSKRMEFFRQRLIHTIQHQKGVPKEIREVLLRFKECPGSASILDTSPLCGKLGKCPRGKLGFLQECCACYNRLRSDFVERNLYLVVNITRQYRTYGIPMMDLIQEGNAALIRAVEKYDWRKGVRFQTYATFWIKQAVERCITANKGIVRVPNYLQQKMRRFRRTGVISSDKASVSVQDVSEAFELSSEVAGHLLETGRGYISLDAPSSSDDEGSATMASLVAVQEEEVMPTTEFQKLRGRLAEALEVLTEQERFIITRRFGLEGAEVMTLEEIGGILKVSRERIRQLQIRALKKLKRPSLVDRLAPFLS